MGVQLWAADRVDRPYQLTTMQGHA